MTKILRPLPALILTGWLQLGQAAPLPSGDSGWYYAIGGAEPITAVLTPNAARQKMSISADFGLSYSCGKFDIVSRFKNLFDLGQIANYYKTKIVNTVTGAIQALPLYIIQRATPALYELFQTYSAEISLEFADAVKTCEQYEREILAGRDPYEKWIQAAKGIRWRKQMSFTQDAVEAKENVESVGASMGVPFPKVSQGAIVDAGGTGSQPIEPVRDITGAGWNVVLGRNSYDNSNFTTSGNSPTPRLVELFPKPKDAADFAVEVLGDIQLENCRDVSCDKKGIPGNGLGPSFHNLRDKIARDLVTLLQSKDTPAASDLKAVSAPGVAVSARVINALRQLPSEETAILAGRLATEAALARTIEKALAVRRLLIAGKRVPEVVALAPASEEADKAIAEIQGEIDNLLYEQRVSKEIASNTAAAIVERYNHYAGKGQSVKPQQRPDNTHFEEGGKIQ